MAISPVSFPSAIPVTLNLNPEAMAQVKEAVLLATKEVFDEYITPQAKHNSPVTPEGYARNLELKAQHKLGGRRVGGTGHNRESIDDFVEATDAGVEAQLFTTSGYGGYLETGTARMRAQPYLYPAFEEHIEKLPAMVKVRIEGH